MKVGTDAMLLGAIAGINFSIHSPLTILDIGTGNGVIALMLAQRFNNAKITAIDIHNGAISDAQQNFSTSPFSQRLKALAQNFLHYQPNIKFQLIVSNPPYYQTKMLPDSTVKGLAKHEQNLPLHELILHAKNMLTNEGELWLILPNDVSEKLIKAQTIFPYHSQLKIMGKPGSHKRTIVVFSMKNINCSKKELTVRDHHGNYTTEYKKLTQNFHFNKLN